MDFKRHERGRIFQNNLLLLWCQKENSSTNNPVIKIIPATLKCSMKHAVPEVPRKREAAQVWPVSPDQFRSLKHSSWLEPRAEELMQEFETPCFPGIMS